MITKISAEFDCPEIAELALRRIRESVQSVYSTNMMYNKTSDKARKLRGGSIYTVIPTAVTTHNYLTAVLESPACEDVIPEPARSRKTTACIVCDDSSLENVSALLNAMGGLNIR
jgi:hypothetical protein